jgi:hypothetical protein
MSTRPSYRPFDARGRRIRTGDIVRVVGAPDRAELAEESVPVFERLIGSYRRVAGFDEYGHVEISFKFRGGPEAGDHTVWLEPHFLRVRRPRGVRAHSS